jgi:disulfide bond formation protein DsbB
VIDTRRARRLLNAAGFGLVVALMCYALYAQHVLLLDPCPLCILQRIAMIALGVVFAVAALHAPRGAGARVYAGLGGLVALAGLAVSAWHVRLQNLPPGEAPPACGAPFDVIMDVNGWWQGLAVIFQGSGECTTIDWTFLGLSMPAWVFVWFVALGALAVVANWSRLSR